LTGCGQDSGGQPQNTAGTQPGAATPVATTTGIQPSPAVPAGGGGVPVSAAQQALQTAAQAVPNGRVFDLEVETHHGRRVFDIKVGSNGNEIKALVDQDGRQIISQNQASTPSDDVAKIDAAQIDASRAVQTAAEREPNATISELEIDTNGNGALVWQVELVRPDGSEVEIDVDAQNGSIIRTS
jgi:uncharacterized membrane protein YkoI